MTELRETEVGLFLMKDDKPYLYTTGKFTEVPLVAAGESKPGKAADKPAAEKKADKPAAETPAAKKKRLAAEKKAKEEAEESDDEPTKEDVRTALTALKDAKGPKATKDMLDEFNATSIGKLDESDYAAVIEAVNDILADGSDDDDDEKDPLDD